LSRKRRRDWGIQAIIQRRSAASLEPVELRTTHANGVEPTLDERDAVKKFEDSAVQLFSLGIACEYHAAGPGEVRRKADQVSCTTLF